MAHACLDSKTHYLDITGEYQVFESLQQLNKQAVEAKVMLLPGAGFDVVPSDCLAAQLKAALPSGNKLTLAFTSSGAGLSRGTAKTMVENIDRGQQYREEGRLKTRKQGESLKKIDYGEFEMLSMGISWGDISTAYYSTGIPNIEVFMGTTKKQVKQLKWTNLLRPLLKLRWVKRFLKKQVDKKPPGPSDKSREKSNMFLWGRISDDGTQTKEMRLKTPNGYTLTALTAVAIASRIRQGDFKPGYQTPSTAYGKDFIFEMKGVEKI